MAEQLYKSTFNPESSEIAAVILPEIFGLNPFIKSTTDRFAKELAIKGFALDHLYPATGQSQVYDYDQAPMDIVQKITGEQFVNFFIETLDQIQQKNPKVNQFIVCGFCFGGKLAWLAGTDQRVNRVISFYGSGATQPGFYQGKSSVEALAEARKHDPKLKVIGFFGIEDPSLPEAARQETKQVLTAAGINYQEKVFEAGHAFMNFERSNMYNKTASDQAWQDVLAFLKG